MYMVDEANAQEEEAEVWKREVGGLRGTVGRTYDNRNILSSNSQIFMSCRSSLLGYINEYRVVDSCG